MKRLVLTNANIIDPDTGARPGGTIVIADERISEVSFGPAALRGDDAVIDLNGRWVMPGMFNCHYHASYHNASAALPIGMEAPPPLQTLRASENMRLALESGFTSVISAGAPHAIDASLKAAVEEGTIRGPRMTAGSRDVSTTGHSQDNSRWWWDGVVLPGVVLCDSPDEFRKAVRTEVKRGAEIIKVFATPGHGLPGAPGAIELSEGELSAIVEAAHQRNVKVRGHIANKPGIMTALRLGFDVIDHGDGLDEACIELLLEKGAFLVPSMIFPHRYAEKAPGPVADAIRADMEKMFRILPVANKAGVKLLLGDDFGTPELAHGEYAAELDFYVNVAGIAPLDVIRWATRYGAELAGRGEQLGVVRPGALADLLVVDGDPLADIRVLTDRTKLLAILKGGKFEKNLLAPAAAPQTRLTAA